MDIDIDMVIFVNIDRAILKNNDIDIDKAILKNIDIDKGIRNWLRDLDQIWQPYGTTCISCEFDH